jgi:hypothetical protein
MTKTPAVVQGAFPRTIVLKPEVRGSEQQRQPNNVACGRNDGTSDRSKPDRLSWNTLLSH